MPRPKFKAFDPGKENEMKALHEAIEASDMRMQPFRENAVAAVTEMVGRNYSDDGAPDDVLLNLLELMYTTYGRQLVPQRPKALITSKKREFKPTAFNLEQTLNWRAQRMGLEETLRLAVLQALVSIGIVISGKEYIGSVQDGDQTHQIGEPFVDLVDLDDFIVDMTARRWRMTQFIGHKFRVPLDAVRASPVYDRKVADRLRADEWTGQSGRGEKSTQAVGAGQSSLADFREHVWLRQLYLPQDNAILVTPCENNMATEVLSYEPWTGPRNGPYRTLFFTPVPGNLMPLPIVGNLRCLHEMVNDLYVKLRNQGQRQKNIFGYRGSGADDAQRIKDTPDGHEIMMDDPAGAQEFSIGGINQQVYALSRQGIEDFSYMAGGLNLMAGLGAQSPTATQDQLVAANQNVRLQGMRHDTLSFVRGVYEDLAWYHFHDPLLDETVERKAGTITLRERFTAEMVRGSYEEYDYDIDPYSMQAQTPQSRLAAMMQLLQVALQAYPAIRQQGMDLDWESIFRTYARYTNMAELEEMLVFSGEPPPNAEQGQQGMMGKPAQTTRQYDRVVRGGGNQQAAEVTKLMAQTNGKRAG